MCSRYRRKKKHLSESVQCKQELILSISSPTVSFNQCYYIIKSFKMILRLRCCFSRHYQTSYFDFPTAFLASPLSLLRTSFSINDRIYRTLDVVCSQLTKCTISPNESINNLPQSKTAKKTVVPVRRKASSYRCIIMFKFHTNTKAFLKNLLNM